MKCFRDVTCKTSFRSMTRKVSFKNVTLKTWNVSEMLHFWNIDWHWTPFCCAQSQFRKILAIYKTCTRYKKNITQVLLQSRSRDDDRVESRHPLRHTASYVRLSFHVRYRSSTKVSEEGRNHINCIVFFFLGNITKIEIQKTFCCLKMQQYFDYYK